MDGEGVVVDKLEESDDHVNHHRFKHMTLIHWCPSLDHITPVVHLS
jgi:hypothetical protein